VSEVVVPVAQQSFSNFQPSLAVTEFMPFFGTVPTAGSGSVSGDMVGFVYYFAGNFAPDGDFTQGQLLSTSENDTLFNLIGNTFGGDGQTTFALPNLQGAAVMGVGTGIGLPAATLGVETGSATVTLTAAQLPPNDPSLPGGGDGLGQPFNNVQPSLPLQQLIAVTGAAPGSSAAFVGQIGTFAGSFVPAGWMVAAGQVLNISDYPTLFNAIGNKYGGNGTTTFALPDLRGRLAVGADTAPAVGTAFGQEQTVLTSAQLPGGGVAGSTAPGQPIDNTQPSLAVNYIIALQGVFPIRDGGSLSPTTPILGQIVPFAGTVAPTGWAFCQGQVLPINQNTALFSLLGVAYGGNGATTFALPDLRGRTLVGTGTSGGSTYSIGEVVPPAAVTLSVANLPTEDQPPCFLAGTMVATPSGEILVERLAVGDLVLTLNGNAEPIVWIGTSRVLATPGRRNAATPIIVRKDALADNVPNRDLRVTKGHALYFREHDVLIPTEFLVNHRTIVWDQQAREVEVYHIELATHDVLLANAAPAESYRDDGNRWLFQNADPHAILPERPPYAAVQTGGVVVDAIWHHLLQRSRLRLDLPTTADPDLHLLVDGQRLDGRYMGGGVHTFRLAKPPTTIRVASRAAAQDALGLARDPRLLGVALRQVRVWHRRHLSVLEANDPQWREGCHAFEPDNGFRWTNGNALLPASLFAGVAGTCEIELHVGCSTRYALTEAQAA
jgi:microcystin-dependent protein